ncbi:hypothetical protein ACOTVS_10490 [Aliarcobacter butzleri]
MENYKYIYPSIEVFNDSIEIEQVLIAIGSETNGKHIFCPNNHSKKTKISIYKTDNICKCHNCGDIKGSPVDVAKWFKGGDFGAGIKWLAEVFGIKKVLNPEYIDKNGETLNKEEFQKAKEQIKKLQEANRIEAEKKIYTCEYLIFDESIKYNKVEDLAPFLPSGKLWEKLTDLQKLKVVYTWFYRETFAISDGPQKAKYMYYKKRGIDTSNKWLKKISYLSVENFDDVFNKAIALFPIEILELVGFVKRNDNNEYKLSFNYVKKGGILIVPSFDLYSNMITGFMLRPTHPEQWMKNRHMKEIQLSNTSIIHPIPFGLTYHSLKKFDEFYVTEGHPDGLALPGNVKDEKENGFFSIPGVNGLNESHLGLLKGKKINICFDQDKTGQKSAFGYSIVELSGQKFDFINHLDDEIKNNFMSNSELEFKEIVYEGLSSKLQKAGVEFSIMYWDIKLGSDINDVRINGNLSKIF